MMRKKVWLRPTRSQGPWLADVLPPRLGGSRVGRASRPGRPRLPHNVFALHHQHQEPEAVWSDQTSNHNNHCKHGGGEEGQAEVHAVDQPLGDQGRHRFLIKCLSKLLTPPQTFDRDCWKTKANPPDLSQDSTSQSSPAGPGRPPLPWLQTTKLSE